MPHTPTTQRIAANVRAEMARRQITQSAMSKETGLSQTAISRRLVGSIPFTVNELDRIADILTVPVSHLIGEAVA